MEKETIIQLYRNGLSIRKTSKQAQLSRNTVTKYIRQYEQGLAHIASEKDSADIIY